MNNKDVKGIMKSMTLLIEGLSHELVNKVATLQMKQQGMNKVFPVLMQGYNAAVQNNLISEQLSKRLLEGVGGLTDLNEQLLPMLEVLDRINQYMVAISTTLKEPEYSIQQYILHVLAKDHFNSASNIKKVQVIANDFFTTFPKIFVEATFHHILHHLFDLASAESVDILLSEEQHIVTIIGYRLALKQNYTRSFDYYIYEPYDKSYPGLGLCRLAFHLFGGDILIKEADECKTEYQMVFYAERR